LKKCVYTCLVGNYDFPRSQPICDGWDYICLCDKKFSHDDWKCIEFPQKEDSPSLNSRYPKILPHHFLSDYDYSLYIDANMTILGDVEQMCNDLNWPEFCVATHPDRTCLYQEIDICRMIGKGNSSHLEKQKDFYQKEAMAKSFGLFENGVIFRSHKNLEIQRMESFWWDQLRTFSHRDQVSLPFAIWKCDVKNLVSVLPKGFKKKNFHCPIAHQSAPPLKKMTDTESEIFFKIREKIDRCDLVISYRTPCLLSDHGNWSAAETISFLNRPSKDYECIIVYDLISKNLGLDTLCRVIRKAKKESLKVIVVEDNLSEDYLLSGAINKIERALKNQGFHLKFIINLNNEAFCLDIC